jgi:FkbM family methyltransferase
MLDQKFLCTAGSVRTHSQLGQDALALTLFGTSGYFVEFGAADGFHLSNTYLLENNYSWTGIIAEPNKLYADSLKNRACHIDTRCVYKNSGETIEFFSVNNFPELSTISNYVDSDHWAPRRSDNLAYPVTTVTLDDLLNFYNAPETIEYISVDTEGSELDILSAFSFSRNVKLFTIEHNFTNNRDKIYRLMTDRGYIRILEQFSQWDDWYIKN